MTLELKVFSTFCETKLFKINNIDANIFDFGSLIDKNRQSNRSCGDMQFIIKPYTDEILNKYKINKYCYYKIAKQLSKKLSFGYCDQCFRR